MNNQDKLAIAGGEIKSIGEGVVEGLGIVFSDEYRPDTSSMKDFFTADSHIQRKSSFTVPLFYDHDGDEIGEAVLTKSSDGWVATADLDLTTEAGAEAFKKIKSAKHGFSTGALAHLVARVKKNNGTNWLKKWVVGELSITPRPAEPSAVIYAVKSLGDAEVPEAKEASPFAALKFGMWDSYDNSNGHFDSLIWALERVATWMQVAEADDAILKQKIVEVYTTLADHLIANISNMKAIKAEEAPTPVAEPEVIETPTINSEEVIKSLEKKLQDNEVRQQVALSVINEAKLTKELEQALTLLKL